MSGQRIVVAAQIGLDEPNGIWWSHNVPSALDIDASNDGVYTSNAPQFTIDLSKIASKYLGYQASMMAGYRIHRISVGVRPVDDIDDNDAYAFFAGQIDMFPFTKHGAKALQLARKVEKVDESNQVDNDSLFRIQIWMECRKFHYWPRATTYDRKRSYWDVKFMASERDIWRI